MQRMDSVSGMDVLMTAHSLYHSTLQGDWKEALTAYKNDASIHTTPINSCDDTALHVAVNDGKEDMVAKLVDEIKNMRSWSALEKQNDRGDTPLHCAASRGCLKMCACIAEARGGNNLLEARNKKGETPLFLAALHGHKHAFLYLNSRCPGDHSSRLWKRTSDGETVLHCTIHRELFGSLLLVNSFLISHLFICGLVVLCSTFTYVHSQSWRLKSFFCTKRRLWALWMKRESPLSISWPANLPPLKLAAILDGITSLSTTVSIPSSSYLPFFTQLKIKTEVFIYGATKA